MEILVDTQILRIKKAYYLNALYIKTTLFRLITEYSAMIYQHTPNLGGNGELGDDDSNRVGVLGQLPGAGQLHHLFVSVCGVGQQWFWVSQALDQGLNLIEVSLLPE